MRIFTFFSIVLSFLVSNSWGRTVQGIITDTKGDPVPYANVYVPKLKTGTTSNIQGRYSIELPDDEMELLFRYISFKTCKVTIPKKGNLELNVTLENQVVQIKEIKVLASGEDPAYYVMRRAIAMAPYYANQISEYDCKVYLKGTGVLDKIPRLFRKKLKKEGLEAKKPFVVESVSEVHFELPDQLDQKVIAMRSSGSDNNTSPQEMITNNLYQTSQYGVISPFSKQALSVYRFKLEGVFEDQGRIINKIRVTPKRKGKDLFRGILNVAEDYWNIYSADLQISMPMTVVKMRQQYAAVNDNTWMPVSLDFDVLFKGFGFAFKYKYVASVNEYKTVLNPNLNHDFWDKKKADRDAERKIAENIIADNKEGKQKVEIKKSKRQKKIEALTAKENLTNNDVRKMQRLMAAEARKNIPPQPLEIKSPVTISKNATKNDSTFWQQIRPIPLTNKEVKSFSKKDSIVTRENTPEHKDSIRRLQRHFKLGHLFSGNRYLYKNDSAKYRHVLSTPGIFNFDKFSYNTADGLRLPFAFSYMVSDTLGHSFYLSPKFVYATARKSLDSELNMTYGFNPQKMAGISMRVGCVTTDFNPRSGISRMENSISTLYWGRNHKKFISRDRVNVKYWQEIVNGLDLVAGVSYETFRKLDNNTYYTFIDKNEDKLTWNIPQRLLSSENVMNFTNSANIDISLSYTPRRRYFMRGKRKYRASSKFPTFSFRYKKAIPNVFDSSADFDFVGFAVSDKMNSGFNDRFLYKVEGGLFLNNEKVNFTDYMHFRTDNTMIGDAFRFNAYRALPFYEAATKDKYLSVFTKWESDRLLLKRLPLLNNSLITEHVFINYLTTPDWKNYWELGYGLQNIFLLANVEFVYSRPNVSGRVANHFDFRITFNLK